MMELVNVHIIQKLAAPRLKMIGRMNSRIPVYYRWELEERSWSPLFRSTCSDLVINGARKT